MLLVAQMANGDAKDFFSFLETYLVLHRMWLTDISPAERLLVNQPISQCLEC